MKIMPSIALRVFNFPPMFTSVDVREFLHLFGLETTRFIKRRNADGAIVCVDNESEARLVISRLHQLLIKTHRLKVEYTDGNEQLGSAELQSLPLKEGTKSKSLVPSSEKCFPLGYEGFPPSHLSYRYPKSSPEILQNITHELAGNMAFYYQTLHLMNKMNLKPPFESRMESIVLKATEGTVLVHSHADVSEEESEIESDSEMNEPRTSKPTAQVMSTMKVLNYDGSPRESQIPQKPALKKTKLEIHISGASLTATPHENETDNTPQEQPAEMAPPLEENESSTRLTLDDILRNRIPDEQRSTINVFQNYNLGDPTTKLYIKNLSKQVVEKDLEEVFGVFFEPNLLKSMEIKLMKTGRMKGQAFVTFLPAEYACEDEPLNSGFRKCIDRALSTVNGYILKDKPMVVSYGKSV